MSISVYDNYQSKSADDFDWTHFDKDTHNYSSMDLKSITLDNMTSETDKPAQDKALYCSNCDIVVTDFGYDEDEKCCKQCGLVVAENLREDLEVYDSHTINEKCSILFKFDGRGAKGNNRALMASSADYKNQSYNTSLKEYQNLIEEAKVQLPMSLIEASARAFCNIKEHSIDVFRKELKIGIMAVILQVLCNQNRISKTNSEINSIFKITIKTYNAGSKKLKELIENGVIDFNVEIDPTVDFVNKYFTLLGIDNKYAGFVTEMLSVIKENRLYLIYDTKLNTKIISIIQCLVDRNKQYKATISQQKIEKVCQINKTTYKKYITAVLDKYWKKFKHVYIKYQLTMPKAWSKA